MKSALAARYASPDAVEALNEFCCARGILQNYILPSQKLIELESFLRMIDSEIAEGLATLEKAHVHFYRAGKMRTELE